VGGCLWFGKVLELGASFLMETLLCEGKREGREGEGEREWWRGVDLFHAAREI